MTASDDRYPPKEMALRGRKGAHTMLSRHDVMVTSQPGRDRAWENLLTQVDPEGVLPEEERVRRAKHALSARMTGLQILSAKARRAKKRSA